MEKSVSVGSEKDGHRARVQSIAVSGNNVHVFAVKYVFFLNHHSPLYTTLRQRKKRERRVRSTRTEMGRFGEEATSSGGGG